MRRPIVWLPRGVSASRKSRKEARPPARVEVGWVRRDTQASVTATYCAEDPRHRGLAMPPEGNVLKKAKTRAHLIAASSVALYREMTVSALSLIRR